MINTICDTKSSNCNKQKKTLLEIINIFRIYVLISISVTMLDINSVVNQTAIFIIALLCIFTLSDILINEILPNRFYISVLHKSRHISYMVLSIMIFCISAEYIYTTGYTFSLIRLWLDGGMVAIIAVSDIFIRYMHLYPDETTLE